MNQFKKNSGLTNHNKSSHCWLAFSRILKKPAAKRPKRVTKRYRLIHSLERKKAQNFGFELFDTV
jgi:hypothetical protein